MSATLHKKFQEVVEEALFAGMEAAEKSKPTAMVVGTPKNMVASLLGGDDGGFDEEKPVYVVEGGVCGFAWINFKGRATEGRKFVNWIKGAVKTKYPARVALLDSSLGEPRLDSYWGGVSISVHGYGQSMTRKVAFANAFVSVIRKAEIDGLEVVAMDRMD